MPDLTKPSNSTVSDTRTTRYSSLFSINDLARLRVLIVGVGAYGRQCALRLAQMGVGQLTLVDPDTVSEVNLGPQGFSPHQIGMMKVEALAEDCGILNPDCLVETYPIAFPSSHQLIPPDIIISASDSMECRKALFEWWRDHTESPLLLDNRMGAEALHLFTVKRQFSSIQAYQHKDILFPQSEAYQAPCTARSTSYCPDACCALTLTQITKHLRNLPLDFHIHLNLLTVDLFVKQVSDYLTKDPPHVITPPITDPSV